MLVAERHRGDARVTTAKPGPTGCKPLQAAGSGPSASQNIGAACRRLSDPGGNGARISDRLSGGFVHEASRHEQPQYGFLALCRSVETPNQNTSIARGKVSSCGLEYARSHPVCLREPHLPASREAKGGDPRKRQTFTATPGKAGGGTFKFVWVRRAGRASSSAIRMASQFVRPANARKV